MRLISRISTLTAAATSALIVVATASAQQGEGAGSDIDVVQPAVWTAVAVAVGAVVFGTLYLLKKQVGGFPEHPDWVAPIEIIESRTLPTEMDEGHGDAHDAHGASHH